VIQYSNVRYLQSKQPVDDRAINRQVLGALQQFLKGRSATPRVLELGAGVGTMVSRLADWNVLGRAEYTLIDRDADSLAAARRHLEAWGHVTQSSVDAIAVERGDERIDVEFVQSDLFEFLDAAERREKYDLVFANAVLDLTDLGPTLPQIWKVLAPGAAYWFTINFDGETIFLPEHPLDASVMSSYHGTMTRDAAGTRAGHPQTGRRLLLAIPQSGASVAAAGSSDWVVFPSGRGYPGDEAYFLHHILETINGALAQHHELGRGDLEAWLHARHDQVERGELVYIAHQLDMFGLAPTTT
jgi:SAM-dependent methyltransferase